MREAQARVVELDDAFPHRRLERLEDALPVSVRRRDQLDRRPGERRDLEEDVDRLRRQPGEAAAEQLVQALRHSQRPAGRRSRVRPDELAAELEREERVARRCLLDAGELRPRQLEPEPLLEQMVERAQAERAEREPLSRSSGKARSSSNGAATLRRLPQRRQQTDALVAQTAESDLEHAGRGRVEPLDVVERDEDRALLRQRRGARRAARARSRADPERASPGSTRSSATSSARRRSGASDGATSSNTGASRSESPAKESDASASTPRQIRTRSKRRSASSTPVSHRIVLPIPASPGEHERRRALLDRGEKRLDRAELLVAPDHLRSHALARIVTRELTERGGCPITRRTWRRSLRPRPLLLGAFGAIRRRSKEEPP